MPLKHRDSFLELYRIILMLAIVAHHYVVNSGVWDCLKNGGANANSLFLHCFGAWGKVGINCFVLITGYFMCTSNITLKKFLKLYLQMVFYSVVLNAIFVITGFSSLTWRMAFFSLFQIGGIVSDTFSGAFLVFFLTIPFLNILVNHMTKRQHALFLALLIPVFTILPFFPGIAFAYNHVEWFAILFLISSYLRKYPTYLTENRRLWYWLSLAALICGFASVIGMAIFVPKFLHVNRGAFYFLIDANKFTALATSLAFFLAFKPSQKIADTSAVHLHLSPFPKSLYSPIINTIASATFGVFLIHANSDAMRRWLWRDVCHVAEFYTAHTSTSSTLLHGLNFAIVAHAFGCVFAIFTICVIIDLLRQRFIEKPLFARLFPEKDQNKL